jgi:hypothetical protein
MSATNIVDVLIVAIKKSNVLRKQYFFLFLYASSSCVKKYRNLIFIEYDIISLNP